MKKTILTMAFFASAIFISCSTSSQKVEKAESNVKEASMDLEKANKEYLADIETCRKQTNEKIAADNQSTAEFKERIKHSKKAAKAEYLKKIAELEKKNNDMKRKMDEYKAEGRENWEKFKTEFNNQMNALDAEFRELMTKTGK